MTARRGLSPIKLLRQHARLATTIGVNGLSTLLSGIVGIGVARLLGPQGRGIYATAVAWGSAVAFIVQLGLNQAIVYVTAKDRASVGAVLSSTLTILAAQSLVIYALAFLVVPHMSAYPRETQRAVQLYLIYVPSAICFQYLTCFALGGRRIAMFNSLKLMASIPLVLAIVTARARTITGILGAACFWGYALCIPTLIGLFRSNAHKSTRSGTHMIKTLLQYGLRAHWANMCTFANMRLDQLVLSFAGTAAALGQYSVGASYSMLAYPVSASIANLVFPKIASGCNDRRKAIRSALTGNAAASGLALTALWTGSHWLVPLLYGRRFSDALAVTTVLCFAAWFLGMNYVLSDTLRGLNSPGFVSAAEGTSTVITCIGLYLAVPRYGILGAAWVSLLAYGTVTALLSVRLARILTSPSSLPRTAALAA